MIHSDQGSQFSSGDWQSFLKANNLLGSMSRRGNCHDNAVAESFFQFLKRERIKRKIYSTRQDARGDEFDYIEMFYNPKRRHGFNNQLSPVEFEKRHLHRLGMSIGAGVVQSPLSVVNSEVFKLFRFRASTRNSSLHQTRRPPHLEGLAHLDHAAASQ